MASSLYHLFRTGEGAKAWTGIRNLLDQVGLDTVPRSRVATFIGNRFDFVVGVGADGEPKMYSFLDVLTQEVVDTTHVVLVVSLPMSEYEMTPEDEAWFQRLDKLLDRLSKAVLLSEQMEIAEIVRRRLFKDP